MTLDDLRKLQPVIEAAVSGRVIQVKGEGEEWFDVEPGYSLSPEEEYRIKTEPVLRSYPNDWGGFHELVGRVVRYTKKKGIPSLRLVLAVTFNQSSAVPTIYLGAHAGGVSPGTLFADYEFTDGSPCGVYVDEDVKVPPKKTKGTTYDEDIEDEDIEDEDIEDEDIEDGEEG